MSGTGTGSSLVRINSDLMDSSFDTVPEAKEFQLRINASDGTKEYGYTLKKGKRLPYPVSFDGKYILKKISIIICPQDSSSSLPDTFALLLLDSLEKR